MKIPIMKRASRGLFGGKHVRFGNTVSESGQRERRKWEPNVQHKRLTSQTLGLTKRFAVTTHVLRCIDKVGGLDQWLLTSKYVQDSIVGTQWKNKIKEKLIEERNTITRPIIKERKPLMRNNFVKILNG
jgi:large subunit ribosomal protein L28